jgi:predicted AAA+ superfamily ATPase
MFERFILSELKSWRSDPKRKPLLIRGARQVGKTTTVVRFAREFKQFLHLNLEKKEDQNPFAQSASITEQMQALFFLKNLNWADRQNTLVFIDEIQEIPDALNRLRYLHEAHPEIPLLASGSLLEMLLHKSTQVPVGRLRYFMMRPVSFGEFLKALGEDQAFEAWNTLPFPSYAMEKLFQLYHLYALVGGMPEAVARYAEHRDLTRLSPVYESLLLSYLDDIGKYAPGKGDLIRHALRSCFTESGKRIQFARFGHSAYGSKEMGEALRTLERAMLIQLVYPETATTLPFLPDFQKSPRLQFLDTGLMNYFAGLQQEIIGTSDLQSLWQGRMIEHLSGQEILAYDESPLNQLHFWSRDKKNASAEVDFLIPYKGKVIPLEVKSGSAGKLRSLHLFMEESPQTVALRLYHGPIEKNLIQTLGGKRYTLLNIPYFLAGQIRNILEKEELL